MKVSKLTLERSLTSLLAKEKVKEGMMKGAKGWYKNVKDNDFDKNLPKPSKSGKVYKFKGGEFKNYLMEK